MVVSTPIPLYKLQTPKGPVSISQPQPKDQLAVRTKADKKDEADEYELLPIIGWARGLDGELSLYTKGFDSSLFRLALEDGCEEEFFFAGQVPATLREYRLDEYAAGALLYFPAPAEHATIMQVSHLSIAA
ncbi:hypothetical protein SAMN06265337_0669 [Hymenobacter gelipurpurascens]|uniref:Uncharacterized protein n=1 Tax=Hymenobacter gelipurpurascens TaxID=89968 RepID=A0A212T9G2_9BACT|nr:hypothetical protein [Hymenobacter gelipurpurascens]SNC62434.1 hypothetical protein SAMN06265337_0669 [Hymenobacter gelipurpurascens]